MVSACTYRNHRGGNPKQRRGSGDGRQRGCVGAVGVAFLADLGHLQQDFYLMRYADVLLMLSEMTGDAQYMNQVQKRAGVPETPYSLKELQNQQKSQVQ